MVLTVIYVVRHGYRSNWTVDPSGLYHSPIRTPTGIPSDPALASYGIRQAEQLAAHLQAIDPPVDLIYSSPFYRCVQTLLPFTQQLARQKGDDAVNVNIEPGLGEFYGKARFDHPSPASIEMLKEHFRRLCIDAGGPIIVPSTKGESIPELHDRIAYCLKHLIRRVDDNHKEAKSLLICTHAASVIAIGRVLTGRMPEDVGEGEFNAFTCGFSKFTRRNAPVPASRGRADSAEIWSHERPEQIPDVRWRNEVGIGGGWTCETNGDCSFLENGAERGWQFSGDEAFLGSQDALHGDVARLAPWDGSSKL